MRKIILIISIIIITIHSFLLIILNFKNDFVIDKSAGFIEYQIKKNLKTEIEKVKSTKSFNSAKSLLGEYIDNIDDKLDYFEKTLNEEIPKLINEIKIKNGQISAPIIDKIDLTKLYVDRQYFQDWLRYKYNNILRELKNDLNIFLLTNLIIFILVFILNVNKTRSDKVKLLSLIVILAVLISSCIYLFNQNWFYSIILNSYYGYSYSLIILIISGFLLDIGFNKSRITKKLWIVPI